MRTWRPMTPAEVEAIERGYAEGRCTADLARELGRSSGGIDAVILRLAREGRLVRRSRAVAARKRRPKAEAPAPRAPMLVRTCLGCGKRFESRDPPKINRLCISCAGRA